MLHWRKHLYSLLLALLLCGVLGVRVPARVSAAEGAPALDRSFGGDGKLETGFAISQLVLQRDGKLVVAGSVDGRLVLARYYGDGSPDMAFGQAGKVSTALSAAASVVFALAQQDDKLVAAISSSQGTETVLTLVRYQANGSLDQSLDGDGISSSALGLSPVALVIQPDGKLVVAGNSPDPSSNYHTFISTLARFEAGGRLDTTFGQAGIVQHESVKGFVGGLVLQPDGKLVLADGALHERGQPGTLALRYWRL